MTRPSSCIVDSKLLTVCAVVLTTSLGCSSTDGTDGSGGAGSSGSSAISGAPGLAGSSATAGVGGTAIGAGAGGAAGSLAGGSPSFSGSPGIGGTAAGGTSSSGTAGSGVPSAGQSSTTAGAAGSSGAAGQSAGGQGGGNAGGAGAPSNGGAPVAGASGAGGTIAGSGGAAGQGNGAGNGGMSSGGAAGGGTAGGGAAGGGSTTPDIACPQGATFCSGFEGTELPQGTKFHAVGPNSPNAYTFDTTQKVSGNQSLSIPMASGNFYYRALAVPVPGNDFWVRLYVRVSRAFGDNGHDSLFGASNGNIEADVNNEALVEFSEQFDEVLLNTDDRLFNPEGMSTLAADTWHCIEAHYDGGSGNVQIFADGKEVINAPGYAKQTFQSFRIGYMQYHDTRAVWYDDVVVAPMRVNCR